MTSFAQQSLATLDFSGIPWSHHTTRSAETSSNAYWKDSSKRPLSHQNPVSRKDTTKLWRRLSATRSETRIHSPQPQKPAQFVVLIHHIKSVELPRMKSQQRQDRCKFETHQEQTTQDMGPSAHSCSLVASRLRMALISLSPPLTRLPRVPLVQ
jgi:hypothetical protein